MMSCFNFFQLHLTGVLTLRVDFCRENRVAFAVVTHGPDDKRKYQTKIWHNELTFRNLGKLVKEEWPTTRDPLKREWGRGGHGQWLRRKRHRHQTGPTLKNCETWEPKPSFFRQTISCQHGGDQEECGKSFPHYSESEKLHSLVN